MTAPLDLSAPATRARTHARPSVASGVVPTDRPQHGFLLWVGVDPQDRGQRTADIIELAETLGELARELLPTAETYTALSLGESDRTGTRPVELDALGDRLAHLEVVDRHPVPPRGAEQDSARLQALADAPPSRDVTPVAGPRLTIDLPSRRVTVDGSEQRLTYKEFELLAYLVASPGRVVPRSELFASVWRSRPAEPGSRTIDVHVRRLRDKLGLHHEILTVRGAGYRYEASDRVEVVEARQAG